MAEEEIISEVQTFMFAGHDTTATCKNPNSRCLLWRVGGGGGGKEIEPGSNGVGKRECRMGTEIPKVLGTGRKRTESKQHFGGTFVEAQGGRSHRPQQGINSNFSYCYE